ncbi:MAG: hypothetical protein WBP45_14825 [Daejeonella sp.]
MNPCLWTGSNCPPKGIRVHERGQTVSVGKKWTLVNSKLSGMTKNGTSLGSNCLRGQKMDACKTQTVGNGKKRNHFRLKLSAWTKNGCKQSSSARAWTKNGCKQSPNLPGSQKDSLSSAITYT